MLEVKLSVIVTCYNLGHYLEECIESVISYVESDIVELIIVNDGSTETETLVVINSLESQYPKINILHQDNQGLAKARNNGIKLAKGDYIIPLDADNKLRPVFIDKATAILDNNSEIDVVYGNAECFGTKTGLLPVIPFNANQLILNNYIDACACFRKTSWEAVNGYDEQMPVMGFEDWDLWLRMMVNGFEFNYVNEVFFDYRVRENSMLSNAWNHRPDLIEYMFNKNTLKHLKSYRACLIENQKLKEEPPFGYLIGMILKKIKRKLKF